MPRSSHFPESERGSLYRTLVCSVQNAISVHEHTGRYECIHETLRTNGNNNEHSSVSRRHMSWIRRPEAF
jgi:hypothetical protein